MKKKYKKIIGIVLALILSCTVFNSVTAAITSGDAGVVVKPTGSEEVKKRYRRSLRLSR